MSDEIALHPSRDFLMFKALDFNFIFGVDVLLIPLLKRWWRRKRLKSNKKLNCKQIGVTIINSQLLHTYAVSALYAFSFLLQNFCTENKNYLISIYIKRCKSCLFTRQNDHIHNTTYSKRAYGKGKDHSKLIHWVWRMARSYERALCQMLIGCNPL